MLLAHGREFQNHSHQFTYGGSIKGCLDIGATGEDLLPGLVETNSVGCPGKWEVSVLCLLLSRLFPLEAGKLVHLLERECICTEPARGFFHSAWPGCAQTLVFFPVSSRCSAVRSVLQYGFLEGRGVGRQHCMCGFRRVRLLISPGSTRDGPVLFCTGVMVEWRVWAML